jgi:hypothetical protein
MRSIFSDRLLGRSGTKTEFIHNALRPYGSLMLLVVVGRGDF